MRSFLFFFFSSFFFFEGKKLIFLEKVLSSPKKNLPSWFMASYRVYNEKIILENETRNSVDFGEGGLKGTPSSTKTFFSQKVVYLKVAYTLIRLPYVARVF